MKCLLCWSVQKKECFQLHTRHDVSGKCEYLIIDISVILLQTEGDERGFQKSVKIVGFQMKVLVMMTRDYVHGLRDAHSAIYRLILYLLRSVYKCGFSFMEVCGMN